MTFKMLRDTHWDILTPIRKGSAKLAARKDKTAFIAVLALFFCVYLGGNARAAEKDQVKFPDFHTQAVNVDGKDVAIDVRWFETPFSVGTTDVNALPVSATKSWIVAFQALVNEKYAAFVEQTLDTKQAQRFAASIQSKSEEDRQNAFTRMKTSKVIGEVRVAPYDLVVTVFHVKKAKKIMPAFFLRTDDGYRMITVPYFIRDKMKKALAVGKLVATGKLGPKGGDK